ncbi:MAG: hypothetical protein ACI8W3_001777 [Myxococcota bacterium]|jgi:hypothetical protein
MLDFIMVAIWISAAVLASAGICIVRLVMYPALRRHGIDPNSRGWWNASSREWVTRYKETCVTNGLSLRYWRIYSFLVVCTACLGVSWLLLLFLQFWRFVAAA